MSLNALQPSGQAVGPPERRVLLLVPTAKDAQITADLLRGARLDCEACRDVPDVTRQLQAGAAALLVTEEIINSAAIDELLLALDLQPPWSDLPVIMMMKGGGQSPFAAHVLKSLRNVMLLERPAPTRSVISAVQAAVRARMRQYQMREQLETIRRGERRMRRLVESNIIGVMLCDQERVLEANDAYLRMVGYSRQDLQAGALRWREMTAPQYADADKLALRQIVESGACTPFEKEYIRKDGTRVPVLMGAAALEDDQARYVCFVQDMTAQKEAQRQRAALLESERAARSEAERAGRMKDEFLATLSHELRTPLNAILGWAQLMRRGNLSDADLKEGLDVIERNARVQTQLIEDLLDMSRIISGKLRLQMEVLEPSRFIDAAIETMLPAAQARNIEIRKSIDPHAGPIAADHDRLQQVVWNLLANAVKFTPAGGRIEVAVRRVKSHAEIRVSDNGIGILPEMLESIFERFRQADSSTTRKHSGLGLGLAIVKHLVELHGGTVHALSEGPGRGATFIIQLPISTAKRPVERDGSSSAAPARALEANVPPAELIGMKLLVVDDDPDACELMRRILQGCGAQVLIARSAEQALALVQREHPDVLISDIGMPQTDGYELLRQVRALGRARGGRVPAIALTAFARSEDRARALRSGYVVHVAKPVDPAQLIATIVAVAGKSQPPPLQARVTEETQPYSRTRN